MQGQAQVTYLGPVVEAAFDHQPTYQALKSEEQANAQIGGYVGAGNGAAAEEIEQGQHKEQSGYPAEQAVAELHVVDKFECVQLHAIVDELVFGRLPVLGEFALPSRSTERRHDAGDDVPLDDG